jgi:ribosomal protein S18 acetylase RimI-like enzyme
MDCVIRLMTENDIPLLSAWMVELPLMKRYNLTVARAAANFETGMARGDWLVTADGESAACGFAWGMPRGAFGRSPYLRLIGVRADAAGKGVGAALLGEIERRGAEEADDLFLLVSDFNQDAQRFYRRHGYEQVGALPDYVLSNVSELIFRKRFK